VYFAVATACCFAYRAAGMGWADAFMHMCTTMGLGGFSSYDASFGHFNSPAIEAVAIVFMLLAGVNFALYFAGLEAALAGGAVAQHSRRGFLGCWSARCC
jgi:trk system potassium uptake protein TrkH